MAIMGINTEYDPDKEDYISLDNARNITCNVDKSMAIIEKYNSLLYDYKKEHARSLINDILVKYENKKQACTSLYEAEKDTEAIDRFYKGISVGVIREILNLYRNKDKEIKELDDAYVANIIFNFTKPDKTIQFPL